MIFNYFCRISKKDMQAQNIIFRRIVLSLDKFLDIDSLSASGKYLCPCIVETSGVMEDSGCRVMQIDFANEFLGGGVLGGGNVQEEIRFSQCPELISSMLFMESMASNEAILFQGFEQFSQTSGYGGSLRYSGDFNEGDGHILNQFCAIDAIPYSYRCEDEQYHKEYVERDINKAYAGFVQPYAKPLEGVLEMSQPDWWKNLDPTAKRVVATGNWGCGCFGGNPQLKSLLQWVAASYADCPAMVYYTFANEEVAMLGSVAKEIENKRCTIGQLMTLTVEYCRMVADTRHRNLPKLFDFILKRLAADECDAESPMADVPKL